MPTYTSKSQLETIEIGRGIGQQLSRPTAILLYGGLGAGKTVLTTGIAEGAGIRNSSTVHSPTFTLVNQYATDRGTLIHIDLYRLETVRELYSIGIDEILSGDSLVVIEWAEKLPFDVPGALIVKIDADPRTEHRTIEVIEPADRLTN